MGEVLISNRDTSAPHFVRWECREGFLFPSFTHVAVTLIRPCEFRHLASDAV